MFVEIVGPHDSNGLHAQSASWAQVAQGEFLLAPESKLLRHPVTSCYVMSLFNIVLFPYLSEFLVQRGEGSNFCLQLNYLMFHLNYSKIKAIENCSREF